MYINAIRIVDHVCKNEYVTITKFGPNQICGTQQDGSAGEEIMGGPNWPQSTSTTDGSEQACASRCDAKEDCAYYIWFSNKGCRLQTNCNQTVDGYTSTTSFICKKGTYC